MNFKVEAQYPISIFKNNNIPCSWTTVKVGWDLKRLTEKEIGVFALDYSELHPGLINEYISELVFGVKDYQAAEYLAKVFDSLSLELPEEASPIWNQEWRKWRFCIMSEMYTNIKDHDELLVAIDGVYADFGYPVDMVPFIYYMPSEDLELIKTLTPEQAQARLVGEIGHFLISERKNIENGCDTLPKKIY